jgi:serine/threonine protein kinase
MILRQLACGFQELQRNNIIHRDLKPANIFSSGGNFKIGDLGFARVLQKNEDLTTTLLGSLCYMAPEILTYKKYGFLVDIWSLGVILHMMVTGRRPFGTPHISNFAQMHDAIKNTELSFHNCKISKELEGLLRGMLTIDPAERMQWEAFYSHPLLAEE